MSIPEFIDRCERYRVKAGVSQNWLSKKLFSDTFRIKKLAAGEIDVGVKRLERAVKELRALERELPNEPGPDPEKPPKSA